MMRPAIASAGSDAAILARAGLQHPACVYVFGFEGGPVKVGMSADLWTRVKALRKRLPGGRLLHFRAASFSRARFAEALAHQYLGAHSLGGEVFMVDADAAVSAVDGAVDAVWRSPVPLCAVARVFRLRTDWRYQNAAQIVEVVNGCAGRSGVSLSLTDAGRLEFSEAPDKPPPGGPGVRLRAKE